MSAFTNPVGWVPTLAERTGLWSSFNPGTSVSFGAKRQFTYLQVAEPQIGSRLVVFDPSTNKYAYVNATELGPSGPPPQGGKGATAVVRSLVE